MIQQPTKQWHSLKLEEQTLGKWADFFPDISRLSRQAVTLVFVRAMTKYLSSWGAQHDGECCSDRVVESVTNVDSVATSSADSHLHYIQPPSHVNQHPPTDTKRSQTEQNSSLEHEYSIGSVHTGHHTHTYTRLTALFPGLPG